MLHSDSHDDLEVRSLQEYVGYQSTLEGPWISRGQKRRSQEPIPEIDRSPARKARPNDGMSRGLQEADILQMFKQRALPHLDHTPGNDWEWLAVARHYGLWTRLLDWTENALAALYFAVEGEADDDFSVVYCYRHQGRPDEWTDKAIGDPLTKEHLVIYHPRYISTRIAAQEGIFTVHPEGFHEFDSTGTILSPWPERWTGLTRTIQIPKECRREIRVQLARLGVHRASLFPDADGVAGFVNWSAT